MLLRFAGAWALNRRIEPDGSLTGTASFLPLPDGCFDYREEGELRLGNGTFRAERCYLFEPRNDGFAVYFAGEPRRLFHEIVLHDDGGALVGEATHLCGADTYVSTYHFGADSFTITHRVTGSRKNYTMTTLYTRASQQQAAA
jgi:hypothetical protein